jgi:hypothetical protein
MRGGRASVSATKCIERTRREHEEILAEFNSLMSGVEATLQATGMEIRRMPHEAIFLEVKRARHPLGNDVVPYRPPEQSLAYESARSQMANVNLEDESDDYLKIGGLFYSWITLKDLPDATFPGILRELVLMDFPLVINAEVTCPPWTRRNRLGTRANAQRGASRQRDTAKSPDRRRALWQRPSLYSAISKVRSSFPAVHLRA